MLKRLWVKALFMLALLACLVFLPGATCGAPTAIPKPTVDPETLKATATTIDFDSLARKTEDYVGQYVYYRCKVIQVMSVGSGYALRVDVTKGKYDLWTDTVYVNYTGERLLEDDIIDLWGQVVGRKSYTSILRTTIELPEIDAILVEVVK
jgi:hypothetical protein